MLYKLYIQRYKEGILTNYELFKDMATIYRDNGVIVLGHWVNKNNPDETILITVYKDKEHYQSFINNMKSNPDYLERQKLLDEIRESFLSKDLELNKHSVLQPSDVDLMEYVADVKTMIDDFA
ncbi:MAG: hypothetical protein ACXAD7_04160 [Candidatus Kariarchaeaceae archaeon]|jgi:hypothetical protein